MSLVFIVISENFLSKSEKYLDIVDLPLLQTIFADRGGGLRGRRDASFAKIRELLACRSNNGVEQVQVRWGTLSVVQWIAKSSLNFYAQHVATQMALSGKFCTPWVKKRKRASQACAKLDRGARKPKHNGIAGVRKDSCTIIDSLIWLCL